MFDIASEARMFLLFVGGVFAFVGFWGLASVIAYAVAAANRRVQPLPQEYPILVQLRGGVTSLLVGFTLIGATIHFLGYL